MRSTIIGFSVGVVVLLFAAQVFSQIPERTLFQPGSYAYGPSSQRALPGVSKTLVTVVTTQADVDAEVGVATTGDSDKTEWEKMFGKNDDVEMEFEILVADPAPVPYLAYYRCPVTHRIHIIPHQLGYEAAPDEFPRPESHLKRALSTLPSRKQTLKQQEYLGYYDPMPTIIEDRPNRVQLILGYPDARWTSPCENRFGQRLAHCIGVEAVRVGPPAEATAKSWDNYYGDETGRSFLSGIFGHRFRGHVSPHAHAYGQCPHHKCQCEKCAQKTAESDDESSSEELKP